MEIQKHLHSNMYLLILCPLRESSLRLTNLHSNMYLLILVLTAEPTPLIILFTFQHVSINSLKKVRLPQKKHIYIPTCIY